MEEPPLGYKYAASELKKLYNSLKVGQQIKLRDFLAGVEEGHETLVVKS